MKFDVNTIQNYFAAALFSLPRPILSWLAGPAVERDGNTLDTKTQFLLKLLALRPFDPTTGGATVEAVREVYNGSSGPMGPPHRDMSHVIDRGVPGPVGEVPVRVFIPKSSQSILPVTVFYHGGGWVIGNLDTHDPVCRAIADAADTIVVSVDYRLAPEHRHPAAVDDAIAAYRWVIENAGEYGGDGNRIAVAGDSAGGNLAAVVAQQARAESLQPPIFQLLVYPVTDLRCDSESYETFADGFFLTRNMMRWFRGHYLGETGDVDNPTASPIRAGDVSGLCPALVMTAGFDPLRDEGRAYADALREAGGEVEYRCYDSLIHGFYSLQGAIDAARPAFDDSVAALRAALHPS